MDNNGSVLEVQSASGKFNGFNLLTWLDPENLQIDLDELWRKVSTQDYAFDDFSRGKVEWFVSLIADVSGRSKLFLIGDYGLFLVNQVMTGGDTQVHFIIWDRNFSLHKHKEYVFELFDYLFYEVKVHRITGSIPRYNNLAPRFALSVGMRFEGELQEAVLWKGKYHNVQLYGILEGWYRNRKERLTQ